MSSSSSFEPSDILLTWRVHLLRREPRGLSILLTALALAALGVWTLFGALLPVLAAILLLLGATGEYLFPITYRITRRGVTADSLSARMSLRWQEVRRCLTAKEGLLLTPLPTASRLDAFRGVLLRFAPDGEPGDRASVMAVIEPHLPAKTSDCRSGRAIQHSPQDPGVTSEHENREVDA